jgi:hypothetical protein
MWGFISTRYVIRNGSISFAMFQSRRQERPCDACATAALCWTEIANLPRSDPYKCSSEYYFSPNCTNGVSSRDDVFLWRQCQQCESIVNMHAVPCVSVEGFLEAYCENGCSIATNDVAVLLHGMKRYSYSHVMPRQHLWASYSVNGHTFDHPPSAALRAAERCCGHDHSSPHQDNAFERCTYTNECV